MASIVMLLYSVAIFVVSKLIYRLFLYLRYLSPLRHLPGPSMGNPILGRSTQIADPKVNKEWVRKYGACFRVVGILGTEAIVCMTPEALEQILVRDWMTYPRPVFLRNSSGLAAGRGLFTTIGNEHKRLRTLLDPAFSRLNLNSLEAVSNTSIERLVEIFRTRLDSNPAGGEVLPLYDWVSKLSLDIICEGLFGHTVGSLDNPNHPLFIAFQDLRKIETEQNFWWFMLTTTTPGAPHFLMSKFVNRYRHWLSCILPSSPVEAYSNAMWQVKKVSTSIFQTKRSESAGLGIDEEKKDILGLLIRDGTVDGDILEHIRAFISAGNQTLSTTLSSVRWINMCIWGFNRWHQTLYLLAKDSESQRRLREELHPIFATSTTPVFRDLNELLWLNCVISESLRLNPAVPVLARTATETARVDGVLIPKGTLIIIPLEAINTWTDVWGPDADEFRPSRWLDLPRNFSPAFSSVPFSTGHSSCIGRTLATMQLKMIIASLMFNFEFSLPSPDYIPDASILLLRQPQDHMPLHVRRVM
ncbi:cytochrome P450 [Mycena metata]|uniref:Cytochrome P450 n=1 Tax=Mycena metata TaxID=1033252 RepID=A0AAD7IS77_9AGAR|nr:cytochrome P450 [Mycena metata]